MKKPEGTIRGFYESLFAGEALAPVPENFTWHYIDPSSDRERLHTSAELTGLMCWLREMFKGTYDGIPQDFTVLSIDGVLATVSYGLVHKLRGHRITGVCTDTLILNENGTLVVEYSPTCNSTGELRRQLALNT